MIDRYFISAIEGWVSRESSGFAIIGDSITDGRGSDTDMNNRYGLSPPSNDREDRLTIRSWPDLVLAKMQRNPNTSSIAVLNQAAGGNRILHDGLGPNVISRVDRDVLAQSGIKYAMIFEGINDIGVANPDSTNQTLVGYRLISAYEQIVARVHTFGIPIFAATITPFGTPENSSVIQPYSSPVREQTRQRINAWIRTSGMFDAVIDFDAIVRNPESISELAPQYDSGDHLHPNFAGYQAIAD
jgi:lysophospholipase L1-like esterase